MIVPHARPQKVICWDLDETIGSFRDYSDMRLTRGIRPLIEELSRDGIRNVITTAALKEHAEFVLDYFSLGSLFSGIFDRDAICDQNYNKSYGKVAEALGIGKADAEHRMIVIGNMMRDSPADLDLVFFYHPLGFHYDSFLTQRMLSLLSIQESSWSDAFSILMKKSGSRVAQHSFRGKIVSDSGLSYALGHARLDKPQPSSGNRIAAYAALPDEHLVYPVPGLENAA
jgi:hypothetical protein